MARTTHRAQRSVCVIASAILLLLCAASSAAGQSGAPAFDVVSIKPSRPNGPMMFRTTETGYQSQGTSLWGVVMAAYFPRSARYWYPDRLQGAPAWVKDSNYDVTAKLDAATIEQWKNLTPVQRQRAMMPLLQKMLAERCKLAAHTVPAEAQGYALVVSKRGAKLTPSKPGAAKPEGAVIPQPDGGWQIIEPSAGRLIRVMKLRNVTMAEVAERLVRTGERPVEDQTGLKGRYDLDLPLGEDTSDMAPSIWDLSGSGLGLKAMKVPALTVVIDHMEKPTTN